MFQVCPAFLFLELVARRIPGALPVLATSAYGKSKIIADHINVHQRSRTVSHQGSSSYRISLTAIFNQVSFRHFKNEITIDRVYLSSTHFPHQKTNWSGTKDFSGIRV